MEQGASLLKYCKADISKLQTSQMMSRFGTEERAFIAILLTGRWGSLGEISPAKLFAGKLIVVKDSSVSALREHPFRAA